PIWPGLRPFFGRQRAITTLTFALNHAFGGFEPRGYHVVNVVIHVLAGLCLFGIVRRTAQLARFADHTCANAVPLAFTIAALWLAHPLQTESVTYTVQRAESLMGLCYLATLYCAIRAATGACAWQGPAVLACALGMGSKPVMVTAPLVVLAYDRMFLADTWRTIWLRRRWMYLGLASSWSWIALCGLLGALVDPASARAGAAGFGMEGIGVRDYLLTQPAVLLHYLGLALVPHPLVIDYGWPIERSL